MYLICIFQEEFIGLVPLVTQYLDNIECDVETRCTVQQYLRLISKRASGELKTTARWIRDFVASHPEYKQDSVITEGINYDLLIKFAKVRFCHLTLEQNILGLKKTTDRPTLVQTLNPPNPLSDPKLFFQPSKENSK